NAGITLHIACPYGANDHHKAEAMFKALARALRQATEIDPRFEGQVVSTKGAL
ncbi:MAG: imidazoleglycerol-phosphate dehydratase, partial [Clostridiales bacterium]|nr:imidazoleglycerol-phosphate dehydratase [Clostridiales bacterium]